MATSPLFGFDLLQKKSLQDELRMPDAQYAFVVALAASVGVPLQSLAPQGQATPASVINTNMIFTMFEAVFPLIAMPKTDPHDGVRVWNNNGVLKVATGP